MTDVFFSYLKLGFQHIVDINGFDHILFVITLCAAYQLAEWRKIAIVITAFTVGHSVTLILASLHIIVPNRYLIDLLIPMTILFSSVFNLIPEKFNIKTARLYLKYSFALLFGLIHGMSFSSFFSDLMGGATSIIFPLFSFNVGIEIGQFFVIFLYYLLLFVGYRLLHISYRHLAWFFSVLGVFVSLVLIFKRF